MNGGAILIESPQLIIGDLTNRTFCTVRECTRAKRSMYSTRIASTLVALARYLRGRIEGVTPPFVVRSFAAASRIRLTTSRAARLGPLRVSSCDANHTGQLLPSAHGDRARVPRDDRATRQRRSVPKTYLLCEDATIIGTPFFVMEYVDGIR
jgi:aminoglycoside phosphotransferase (APT) family kinase protein